MGPSSCSSSSSLASSNASLPATPSGSSAGLPYSIRMSWVLLLPPWQAAGEHFRILCFTFVLCYIKLLYVGFHTFWYPACYLVALT